MPLIINPFILGPPPVPLTWSTTAKYSDVALSNGNRTATGSTTGNVSVFADRGASTLKRYCEIEINVINGLSYPFMGAANGNDSTYYSSYVGGVSQGFGFQIGGDSLSAGVTNNMHTTTEFVVNDVAILAFDFSLGYAWFGRNGTWANSGDPVSGSNPSFTGLTGTWYIGTSFGGGSGGDQATIKGSSDVWSYVPPTGFIQF